ncbi:MAG: Gfo/Idh/MocA family oxidoreductase [Lachnospiraceae bacterium]|nr:Gfo/Idh/MocA family oxidoreductase [Lachnospiraceae bacterium]
MERIKTAVIGCGMISDIYLRNLSQRFPAIDLAAVANRDPEKAKRKAGDFGIGQVLTIDEVADDPSIGLVVVLTPVPAHYAIIRKMLEAGKHVYTEKMFTSVLSQAEELIRIADQNHLLIGVAPDTVLGAGTQSARYYLDDGRIGDVTGGIVAINRNQSLNSEHFRFLQEEGGALPYDVGIYYIATLVTLLGCVKAVRAFAAENGIALADAARRWGHLWREGIPFSAMHVNDINHPAAPGMAIFADALMDVFGGDQ